MKTILIKSSVLISVIQLIACSGERGETATAESITPYPLEACIVADEPLGSMGESVVIIHEGREIKFCCDSCRPKFESAPAKYLPKLDQSGHNH